MPVANRIADTLRSSLDTDLALSNALTNFPTGAIDNLRSMIKAIADRETICHITTPSGTFNYESTEHMWVTLNNLSPENIQESHAECAGQFEGYLTNARSAEYRRTKPGDLILATIAQTSPTTWPSSIPASSQQSLQSPHAPSAMPTPPTPSPALPWKN